MTFRPAFLDNIPRVPMSEAARIERNLAARKLLRSQGYHVTHTRKQNHV